MKKGLVLEEGKLIYYVNGKPKHAGVVKIDGAIYYISSHGHAVTGKHVVHRSMANGILKHGTYVFGEDGRLIENSYVAPRKKTSAVNKVPDEMKTAEETEASDENKAPVKRKKRRSRKRSRRRSWKRIITSRVILAACLLAGLVAATILVDVLQDGRTQPVSGKGRSESAKNLQIILPTYDEEVLLCSEAVKLAYDHEMEVEDAMKLGEFYQPFYFKYNLYDTDAMLLISEDPDMKDARAFLLKAGSTMQVVDNLKVATTYHYRVMIGDESWNGSFKTARSTRFVKIPGVLNTRDIGGYITLDGKTVKQGLLIRGKEMDGLVDASSSLASNSREEVQDTFAFVYDLDLRETSLDRNGYQSPLGANVGHKFYQSPQYGQIFNSSWRPALQMIFSDLADPNKYPMYLHCTWGADRTGTIVFLLEGMLNMSLDDMLYDYCLTGRPVNNMDAIIYGVESYEGDTIQEKIENYLISFVGVTESEIASIRNIFLAD